MCHKYKNTKIQYTSIDYRDKNIQVTSQLKAGKFKSHAAVKYHETKMSKDGKCMQHKDCICVYVANHITLRKLIADMEMLL